MLGHPEAPAVSSPESEQTALHHSPPTPASSLPSSHVDGEEFFKGGDLMFLQKSLSGTPSRSGSCKKRPKTCHPHSTAWSVATEKGYRYTEANYEDIHADLEDVHFPSSLSEKQTALCGAKVYILADGHGGPGAARYLVPRLASAVLELLDSLKQQQQQDMPLSGTADWDFSCPKDRELLSTSIKALFLSLDKEYASYKTAQFKKWSAYKRQTQMNKENSQPMDESLDDKEEIVSKPDDDGCTMVANIIHNGYLINCNTGDSRTLLCSRTDPTAPWEVAFGSTDHDTMHHERVYGILEKGGHFVTSQGRYIQVPHKSRRGEEPLPSLACLQGARVYRQSNSVIQDVGLSHRRTLNLTATMGDLLFKLDPPVMSPEPDVQFIPLDFSIEYLLIACTDGIWDHLQVNKSPVQNTTVLDQIIRVLDSTDLPLMTDAELAAHGVSLAPRTQVTTHPSQVHSSDFLRRLALASHTLVDRENHEAHGGIFWSKMIRYDDSTAQLVHLAPAGWAPSVVTPESSETLFDDHATEASDSL